MARTVPVLLGALLVGTSLALIGGQWLKGSADARYRPLVESAINAAVEGNDAVCVHAGPFPYDSTMPRGHWVANAGNVLRCYARYRPGCDVCENLYRAGLLERSTVDAGDQTPAGVRYTLTEQGRRYYRDDIHDADASGRDLCTPGDEQAGHDLAAMHYQPGFCFADGVRLYSIDDSAGPVRMNGETMLGVRYTPEVVNPEPLLSDPAIQDILRDPPSPGTPALLRSRVGTVVIDPAGHAEFTTSFLIGKFATGR